MKLISVVVVTNRELFINICNNYSRQKYIDKELLLIINKNINNTDNIKKLFEEYQINNYKIYVLPEMISLGYCYNFAISKMNGEYFCKMDDDDYYGGDYISKSIFLLEKNKSDIIGKSSFILYDSTNDKLYLKYNKFLFNTNFVLGCTMIIKKNVFKTIKFPNKNRGEDTQLLKDANKNNFKIYSGDYNDFVYVRNNIDHNHTYNVSTSVILGKKYYKYNNKSLIKKIENNNKKLIYS